MFTELFACSCRRDANSLSVTHVLPHAEYRTGAACGCSAKDYISHLPLHVGGTMALDLTRN